MSISTHLDRTALMACKERVVAHGERENGVAVAREGRDGEEVGRRRAPKLYKLVAGCRAG